MFVGAYWNQLTFWKQSMDVISITPATRPAIHLEIILVKNGLGSDNEQDQCLLTTSVESWSRG